jgi:thiol-disulfide isomerase/thioredoxin
MYAKSSTSESARGRGRRCTMKLRLCTLGAVLLVGSTAAALKTGDAPPPIDLPDLAGKKVDLAELKGKVVLVDFWASWCGPCKQEMPVLESLHAKYADQGLVIVGINIDNNPKKMKNFLKGAPVSFRIVHDPKITIAQRYEPSTMPSSYFIGRNGKLRYIHEGFRKKDAEEIEKRVKELLAEGVERGDRDRD